MQEFKYRNVDKETVDRWKENLEKLKSDLSRTSRDFSDEMARRMCKVVELSKKIVLD